ncbi:phytanoyl-CoA dioxygenase family protein [Phreatobacter sp. HK31-P]
MRVATRFRTDEFAAAIATYYVDGAAVIASGLAASLLELIRGEFIDGTRPGQRSFALPDALNDLLTSDGPVGNIALLLMGQPCLPVRVLKFDKNASSNWAVPWHQDRTIAVAERAELPGFEVWSRKGGIDHVEPPEDFLRDMVALRLHLDDCAIDNGPLEIAAGSWTSGRIPSGAVADAVRQHEIIICTADAGEIVAMRGLTLHASQPARKVGHRRVLHVDYARRPLPAPLRFAMA